MTRAAKARALKLRADGRAGRVRRGGDGLLETRVRVILSRLGQHLVWQMLSCPSIGWPQRQKRTPKRWEFRARPIHGGTSGLDLAMVALDEIG